MPTASGATARSWSDLETNHRRLQRDRRELARDGRYELLPLAGRMAQVLVGKENGGLGLSSGIADFKVASMTRRGSWTPRDAAA